MRVYLGKFQFQVRVNAGLFLWIRYPRASLTLTFESEEVPWNFSVA